MTILLADSAYVFASLFLMTRLDAFAKRVAIAKIENSSSGSRSEIVERKFWDENNGNG